MNDEFVLHVLEALVTGYAAREGMKDRFRSLNEYEIARRAGVTAYSYVEYDESAERGEIRRALNLLEREGLVSFVRPAGRYDAFEPTTEGARAVAPSADQTAPAHPAGAPRASVEPLDDQADPSLAPLLIRLDEMIRLLRSIDQRLDALNR